MKTTCIVHTAQKKEFSRRHINKNFLSCKLDRRGVVKLTVQNPLPQTTLVDIVIDSYLLLGCNRIKYCIDDKNSYNLIIHPCSNSMISTIERPTANNQQETVTIDELAQKAELSVQEVEELLENSQIPAIKRNGEWVLTRSSARTLVNILCDQKRDKMLSGIFNDSEGSSYQIEEEPSEINESDRNNTAFDASMQLPADFDIMAGRKRRPDISTALQIAIKALPGGESIEGRNHYIGKIVSRVEASKQFLEAIAKQFPNKKGIDTVVKDLRIAAVNFAAQSED